MPSLHSVSNVGWFETISSCAFIMIIIIVASCTKINNCVVHGRRNRSGRPGNCRTNIFGVYIILLLFIFIGTHPLFIVSYCILLSSQN